MSADRLNKGMRATALLLAVATLGACGTATVVKPAGGRGGTVHTTPQASVAKPGQTAVIRKGDTLYALAASQHHPARFGRLEWAVRAVHDLPGADPQAVSGWRRAGSGTDYGGDRAASRHDHPVATPTPSPTTAIKSNISWRWPADGALVGRFVGADVTKQGVDIAGSSGQPVRATAQGVVVYSGAGLVGFGELIIIKHSDQWLSAYGHNRKRLVNEGQSVKAGEQIAEMGRTGTTRDMLHFEIRYNGKPVDPLLYLPPR